MLGVLAAMGSANERTERELRNDIGESSRGARQETAQAFATFQQSLVQQGAEATRTQNAQLDAFSQQLTLLQKSLADTLNTQLQGLSESNARRLSEVRMTMETQLAQLQQSNTAKLDEMRKTVDESCRARSKPASAKASNRWPTGSNRCTRAWAKCRRWLSASAACSAC
jgi:DNA recombination protein RmuC